MTADSTLTKEKLDYINKLALEAISMTTDEMEGTQAVDIANINACNPDYIDITEPEMSLDDIMHMLHLDDQNVVGQSATAETDETPSILDTDESKEPELEGAGYGDGLRGDMAKPSTGTTDDISDAGFSNKWNDVKYPKDVDMQKVVDAILNDPVANGDLKAIIEFATPSLSEPEGVEYELMVEPGEQITQDTILARAQINGVDKEIRSIFSKGTIGMNEDGSFKRVYESSGADRHIIIENYELCGERPDINTDRIEEITDDFTNEAYIHQLITDNLPDCVLPLILQKRYTEKKWLIGIGAIRIQDERPNGREIFSAYESEVEAIRTEYSDDIQNMGTEDNIRKTNGNIRKINDLGFSIIDRRKKYADDLIKMYKETAPSLNPCEYDDDEFYDCRYLAYDHDVDYRDKKVNLNIGNTEYSNYYVTLLSKVDMLNSTNNKYATEYYEILKKIIEIRMAYEKYNINVVKKEFDTMFKNAINKSYSNAFNKLNDAMKKKNKDITYSDVYSWIGEKIKKGKTKKSEKYAAASQSQLTNIFLFVWNYHEYEIPSTGLRLNDTDIKNALDLVKEEWKKLSEFWDKILAIYERVTIYGCIQAFEDFAKYGERYHNWPVYSTLKVDYTTYEHYLFQNYKVPDQTLEDEDLGLDYDTTEPVLADSYPPPEGEFGPEDMLENEDDVHDDEITLRDFKYWQKYFGLATIISLPFLNCGLDILPAVTLVPLPCIFIAIASVYIQVLDLVIVFGITIRGMYIFPCILFVNCSSKPLSITTPLIAALKTIQSKINVKIGNLMELPVTSLANAMIKVLEEDSRRLRNENKQLDAAISAMESKKVKNQQAIRAMFKKTANPDANTRQHINDPITALTNQV